jgi:hypothetical protein
MSSTLDDVVSALEANTVVLESMNQLLKLQMKREGYAFDADEALIV